MLLEKAYEAELSDPGNTNVFYPFQSISNLYSAEIAEVGEKITELCKARAQLLSLGILHPKYCDIAALSTFLEYLETERVDKLTGPDGAYNLYEAEIRANRIIAQLDKVIDSLEQIKQNQYTLYQEISLISRDLSILSNKMDSAVKSLSAISDNTKSIKNTSEMTAYYAEKTAQYTKRNNELTDALGYLVAFNTLN